jgi:hypothetical protein
LTEADPFGGSGDRREVHPDIRRPGRVVAKEERIVAVAVGELAGVDELAAGVWLLRADDRLEGNADPSPP